SSSIRITNSLLSLVESHFCSGKFSAGAKKPVVFRPSGLQQCRQKSLQNKTDNSLIVVVAFGVTT
ncbi:MAG: hypothetical protein ACRC4V_22990, partial [Aeromonas veronii]